MHIFWTHFFKAERPCEPLGLINILINLIAKCQTTNIYSLKLNAAKVKAKCLLKSILVRMFTYTSIVNSMCVCSSRSKMSKVGWGETARRGILTKMHSPLINFTVFFLVNNRTDENCRTLTVLVVAKLRNLDHFQFSL